MNGPSETSTPDQGRPEASRLLRGEVLVLFWTVTPCVRVFGFFKTARLFRHLAGLMRRCGVSARSARAPVVLGRLVERQASHTLALPTRCTTHSIVLQFLLEQHGHPSELKLGVQNLIGGLRAHAWVEISGQELASNPVGSRYVPFTNA